MTRPRPGLPLPAPTSSPTSSPSRPRGSVTLVALVLIGLLVGLLGAPLALAVLAPVASAHDALTGSTPADGSTVEAPPASVDLTFSEPPLAIGAEVQVTGPDGEVVDAGDLVLTDTVVSQPLAADLPAGAYAVVWRVTSSDGHPISGELAFTATAGAAGTTEPGAAATEPGEPTGGTTQAPTGEPVAPGDEPTSTVDPPEVSQGDAVAAPDGGADPSSGAARWLGLGAVLLAAAGAAAWWARRRSAARADD